MHSIAFIDPHNDIFTVYTKSKCEYCTKVKLLLEDNNIKYMVINCDDYLENHKMSFLEFIKELVCKEWKTFPMVFNDRKQFLGGFKETQKYLEKKLGFDEDF